MFKAGADARPITPTLDGAPVYLAGYGTNRPATTIHDELYVRSLAVQSDHDPPVVITACDLIGLPLDPTAPDRHVVACTHTHHGPDTIGLWGRPEDGITGRDGAYVATVREAIAASRVAALEALEPARLRVGSIAVPDLIRNYRDPDIVDDELSVIRFEHPSGEAIATFACYPCHPEIVDPASTDLTGDWAGHLCRELEARGSGVAVVTVGALGGMLSPGTDAKDHAEAERWGAVLAEAACGALGAPASERPIRFARRTLTVPMENPKYVLALESGLVAAGLLVDGAITTTTSVLDLGPAAIAFVPGELFPRLGFRLKDALRAAGATVPIVVGLADDELGYIVPADEFRFPADYLDPGDQYEESMSVGPAIGPAVCAAVEDLIGELAQLDA